MFNIEVNPKVAPEAWSAYVRGHPEGTYYHLPEWRDVINQAFGHAPFYLFASNTDGGVSGILPMFRISSHLTGRRLVSLPFAHICGPISDSDEITLALVDRAARLCDELKCGYLEIRTLKPLSCGLAVNQYYSTYVFSLGKPQESWRKIGRRARQAVTKSQKDGVTVRIGDSSQDLRTFCDLNMRTKRRLGSPGHPDAFIQTMKQNLEDRFRLYLAEFQGRAIAGSIAVIFNGLSNYAYAASDSRYLKHFPNDAVVWRAMEDASDQGARFFDFGKTPMDNTGLAAFKRKWGSEQKALYYHYYPNMPYLISSDRSGVKYRSLTTAWRKLPLPLVRIMASTAFRHLD